MNLKRLVAREGLIEQRPARPAFFCLFCLVVQSFEKQEGARTFKGQIGPFLLRSQQLEEIIGSRLLGWTGVLALS